MKTLMSVSMVLAAVFSSLPASAAIMMIPESCSAVRSLESGELMVGAAHLDLNCESFSAISGSGTTCTLTGTAIFPGAQPVAIPLTQVSTSNDETVFQGEAVLVYFDHHDLSARIILGNGVAESDCVHVAPTMN
jgi:hypothetical protein